MSIIIKPFNGIVEDGKEVKFGISQKELKSILGEPYQIKIDNIMKWTTEIRSSSEFIFEKKKLINIDFLPNADISINGIELFSTSNVIEKLSIYDAPTNEGKNGYINFYKLGISLGGFGKRKIPEKKIVRVFPENRIKDYELFLKM